jgi:hypothetical protein
MKTIKILTLLILSLFTNKILAQNEIWLETDPAPLFTEVWGDRVGTDVKVDVTCSNETVPEAILEARKIALYKLLIEGFTVSEDGNGSAIPKILTGKEVYDGKKDWFIEYINTEGKGLQYAQGKINTSKPGGEIKDGRKKLKKVTVTVNLRIDQIRIDLEKQGLVTSNKKIADALKYKPKIIIKPSDSWLEKLNAIRREDNQGEVRVIRDLQKITTAKNSKGQPIFEIITSTLTKAIGEGFDVQSISSKLNDIADSKVNDQLSSYGLSESNEDLMARTLSADIYLDVNYYEESVSGNQETQFNIQLSGVDPTTNNNIAQLTGNLISKKTSGDNFTELVKSTLKSASNDFVNGVSDFLSARLTDGMPCTIEFRIAKDLQDEKTFNGMVKNKKFKTLIDETVKTLATTGDKVGKESPTMMNYGVLIPALREIGGKQTANSVEAFSEKVFEEMSSKLEGFYLITQTVGKGKVIAIFTKQEPK